MGRNVERIRKWLHSGPESAYLVEQASHAFRVDERFSSMALHYRLPKPAELSTTDGLEADKDAIDAQLRKISDELQPIMVELLFAAITIRSKHFLCRKFSSSEYFRGRHKLMFTSRCQTSFQKHYFHQAERSKAQTQLAETREVVRELKAQIEDKEMTLSPYQAEKRAAFQERETQRIGRYTRSCNLTESFARIA